MTNLDNLQQMLYFIYQNDQIRNRYESQTKISPLRKFYIDSMGKTTSLPTSGIASDQLLCIYLELILCEYIPPNITILDTLISILERFEADLNLKLL